MHENPIIKHSKSVFYNRVHPVVNHHLTKMCFENHFQNDRDLLKKLINNGQFEIVNGGWGISDESISHYTGTIEESLTIGDTECHSKNVKASQFKLM